MLRQIEHRVGLLIPSSNSTIEPEYYAVMPPSISVHFARLTMTEVNDAGLARQDEDVVQQARLLATAGVEVILFCQTAASRACYTTSSSCRASPASRRRAASRR